MNFRLREEDRRAVDLLLDRGATAAGGGNGKGKGRAVYAGSDPSLGERVARAQKLLQLLEWLPEVEPSPDLAERTMRRIDRAGRKPAPVRGQVPNVLGGQRPVA